jgi:predicted membrane protein
VGGLVVLILFAALVALTLLFGRVMVYLFVIFAALFSMTAFGFLAYAAIQVIGLVREVRGEVKTLVGTAQDTMNEVRGTARFISETVVEPVSTAASWVSATRATAKAFTEPLYKKLRN